MTKTVTGIDFLEQKVQDKIRKAHRAGRKSVTIDGTKLTIKRKTRKVSYETTVNGEKKQVKRTESWLVLNADGKSLPAGQIELKNNGNLRSQF